MKIEVGDLGTFGVLPDADDGHRLIGHGVGVPPPDPRTRTGLELLKARVLKVDPDGLVVEVGIKLPGKGQTNARCPVAVRHDGKAGRFVPDRLGA